jgi:anti-sigma regulatory factor (Ser/Thr protein kinase)
LIAAQFAERELSIPADLARLADARAFADEAAADFGFDETDRYQIKMAMSEAVANAVEHGSQGPAERISLRVLVEDGALTFYVRDNGSFIPRMAPRGAMPERGRGLAFMSQLMDEVDVRPGPDGTVLRFSKRRPAA